MGFIGDIFTGMFGANAAKNAANAQVNAANNAANLQHQDAQDALNFEKSQYGNSLQMLNPYLQTGYGALDLLRTGLGIPGQMPQGFNLNASNPNPSSTLNMSNLGDFNNPVFNRLQALRGGPQPFQATGAAVPNGGFGFNGGGMNLLNDVPGGTNVPGTGGSIVSARANPGAPGGTFSTNQGGGAVQNAGLPGGTSASGSPNLGFGSLLQSYPGGPFVAPTGVTEQNDPAYQFRLKTGLDALNNSAAARGGLLSGGTLKAAQDFAQNDASNEYGNVYNRALNTYGTNYNQFVNDQTNQFNKLAAISGLGQTSAQDLSNAGLMAGGQVGNTLLTSGQQIGQDLNNAGAARASGIIGGANAITGAINNGSNQLNLLALLSAMGGAA